MRAIGLWVMLATIGLISLTGRAGQGLFYTQRPFISRTIEMRLRPGAAPQEELEFIKALYRVALGVQNPQVMGGEPGMNMSQNEEGHLGVYSQDGFQIQVEQFDGKTARVSLWDADNKAVVLDKMVAKFKEIGEMHKGDLSPEQVKAALAKIDEGIKKAQAQLSKVLTLTQSRQDAMSHLQTEKMRSLELEKQKLSIDLASKQSRSSAIREQIREIDQQATTRTAEDPVTKELREAVKLREAAWAQIQARNEAGTLDSKELYAARSALSDARTKLAEREEALKSSVNGELLSRLSGDLVVTAIDQAELKARLAAIAKLLPPEDFSTLTEEQLDQLTTQYTPKGPGVPQPPLYQKLVDREMDLREKRLGVIIREVSVAAQASTRPNVTVP